MRRRRIKRERDEGRKEGKWKEEVRGGGGRDAVKDGGRDEINKGHIREKVNGIRA